MLQLDALASSGQRQATSSTCPSYPPFTQAPQSRFKPVFESGSTGLTLVTFTRAVRLLRLRYVGNLVSLLGISWALYIFRALLILLWMWKKNHRKCLYSSETLLQRLLVIVQKRICKQPSVISKNTNTILHAIITTKRSISFPCLLPFRQFPASSYLFNLLNVTFPCYCWKIATVDVELDKVNHCMHLFSRLYAS